VKYFLLTHATAIAPEGRSPDVGPGSVDKKLSINTLPLHFGRVLTGSHGGGSQPAEDIPRYLRLLHDGCYDVTGFVSHRIPLSQVNDGIAKMRSGEVIHCMIHFPHP